MAATRESALIQQPPPAATRRRRWALWWRESSGSVADLGVLIPIAVALIVANGLSATAVLLPAGLLYLAVAWVYRVPVAVQPLKAFGAIAIAAGVGVDVIAAGALLMGVVFLLLGGLGLLDRVAALFPTAVIRGVQLTVGLLFFKIGWGLIAHPPKTFVDQAAGWWVPVLAAVLIVGLLVLRSWIVLPLVVAGAVVAVIAAGDGWVWGPSAITLPTLSWSALATAAVLLVIPQVPLTFANSCLAPADAAREYFGDEGARVTPNRLAGTLGGANVFAAAIGGMPVCHGAGGMSAHYAFGARTWRAPVIIGGLLTVTAVVAGAALAGVLPAFPLPILAAMLAVAGVAHIMLLKDVRGWRSWAVVIGIGALGVLWNLAGAVLLGLAVWWLLGRVASRARPS